MKKENRKDENCRQTIDCASAQMIEKAGAEEINLAWDRFEALQPQCGFGELGMCCRNCSMGPCSIEPFGEGAQKGVCGAGIDTIVARNFVRSVAGGVAAHSDHGRDMALALLSMSKGNVRDFKIKDENGLLKIAQEFEVKVHGRNIMDIARDVAGKILLEFGKQEGLLRMPDRAPEKQINIWKSQSIFPGGIDMEIVECLHRTTMGVDADFRDLLIAALRAGVADGWGGSMIATELSDIILGSPYPVRSKINLGVLKENKINIIVHGHEPMLSDLIFEMVKIQEFQEMAEAGGAEGINVAGMCCTANELLMRQGIPVAGNFLQQELAVITGAVETLMVDVQCIMPSLAEIASCFHTQVITTSHKAKLQGVNHLDFKPENARAVARRIIEMSVDNFKNRNKGRVSIPSEELDLVAGFTDKNAFRLLRGSFRPSYKPLNDGIIDGRLRGVAGVVGCNNPKITHDHGHVELVRELIKNDILVVQTGCSAIACAKAGLMKPEAAFSHAGRGLREICEATGFPPVLHMGSCVDNSRILLAMVEMVREGGIGRDLSELPVVGAAPEWMSEKAMAIGSYFVASGVLTVFGHPFQISGSKKVIHFLTNGIQEITGGRFVFEKDPHEASKIIISYLDEKRRKLGLKAVLYT